MSCRRPADTGLFVWALVTMAARNAQLYVVHPSWSDRTSVWAHPTLGNRHAYTQIYCIVKQKEDLSLLLFIVAGRRGLRVVEVEVEEGAVHLRIGRTKMRSWRFEVPSR